MLDIIRQMEFRQFVFDEDSEAVVDMHRCAEVLEGSWFDASGTCKINAKIVARTPGSSWVISYGNMVFAHADLLKVNKSEAMVSGWRTHESYNHPMINKILFDGLCEMARKREYSGLTIFGDNSRVDDAMLPLGLQADRKYQFVNLTDLAKGIILGSRKIFIHPDEVPANDLKSFLGSPLPPSFIINKANVAAGHRLFRHRKPEIFEILDGLKTYIACQDGREWHIFKKGDFKADLEIIPSLLKTISELTNGPPRILLSTKALETVDVLPSNDGVYNDYYHPL